MLFEKQQLMLDDAEKPVPWQISTRNSKFEVQKQRKNEKQSPSEREVQLEATH